MEVEALAEEFVRDWLLELWIKTAVQSESIDFSGPAFLTDGAGRILRWGKEAAEAFGYLEEELQGLPIDALVGPEPGARLLDRMRGVMLGAAAPDDWREPVALKSRHGAEEPVELWFSARGEGPGIVWSVAIRRTCEKKAAEPVELSFAVREALQAAAPHLPEDVLVFMGDCPPGLSASAFPAELRRALALLALNAAEAAGPDGRLTFELARPGNENDPLPRREMEGGWVRVSIRRSWSGPPPESAPSRLIRQPGLPLSAETAWTPARRLSEAFALVKSMEGVLDLKWEPGSGVRASIFLRSGAACDSAPRGIELNVASEEAR